MLIYLMRHGIAIDHADPACPADPERHLTAEGKHRTRACGRGMRRAGIAPERVLTSPYRRARQTAAIVREELELATRVVGESDALLPGAHPDEILSVLAKLDENAVLCVGHNPNLDRVVARLLGTRTPVTSLKKAGLVCLETTVTRGTGRIFALYPPRTLRRLGREP